MSSSNSMAAGAFAGDLDDGARRLQAEGMFDQCSDSLYRYVAVRLGNDAELADEIMQQLWLAVSRCRRAIPQEQFEYWLRAIAKNLMATHWRKVRRRPLHVPLHRPEIALELAENIDRHLWPAELVERREIRDQLMLAITMLKIEDQDLIRRHYMNGESFQGIAGQLGMTERAVEGRLYRARRQLKTALNLLAEDG